MGLQVGTIARFFHPMTLGVMHRGKVVELHDDGTVTVRFDVTGRQTFRTTAEHIRREN